MSLTSLFSVITVGASGARRSLRLALIMFTTLAASARAYTGGPQLIDVLGWDAKMERVYVRSEPRDEGYSFGSVYYFDLRSSAPATPRLVGWSRSESAANEPDQADHVRALRARLRRLRPELEETLPSWIVHVDSTTVEEGPWAGVPRFRLRVAFAGGQRFECTSYHHADLCAKGVYHLPGRKEMFWVLAFRGNEGDPAETDVAVLVTPNQFQRSVPVEWDRRLR